MRIEDFMDSNSDHSNFNGECTFYYDLKSFDSVSKDKIDLLESISKYIKFYPINSELDCLLDSDYTIIQTELNGYRVLIKYDLSNTLCDNYDRVGNQNIRSLNTNVGLLYYSKYNHVFTPIDTIVRIRDLDINSIGYRLSKTARDLKLSDSTYKVNHEATVNNILFIRYEKGFINTIYKYKNNELIVEKDFFGLKKKKKLK